MDNTRAFASGGKFCSTYFCPRAKPRSSSVASTQRFQRGCSSLDASQRLAEEMKVFVDKWLGQQRRFGVEQVPAKIDLEIGDAGVRENGRPAL